MELFARCMVEGYETAKPKEQQIQELFQKYKKQGPMRGLIRQMCDIMDIKVQGVNYDEQ